MSPFGGKQIASIPIPTPTWVITTDGSTMQIVSHPDLEPAPILTNDGNGVITAEEAT